MSAYSETSRWTRRRRKHRTYAPSICVRKTHDFRAAKIDGVVRPSLRKPSAGVRETVPKLEVGNHSERRKTSGGILFKGPTESVLLKTLRNVAPPFSITSNVRGVKHWFLKLREWFYRKLHQAIASKAVRALVGYCQTHFSSFKACLITLGTQVKGPLLAGANWLANTQLVSWLMASKICWVAAAGTAIASIPCVVAGITVFALGTMIVSTVSTAAYNLTVIPAAHSIFSGALAA